MSYRLQAGERLAPGVKRIALEQIDDALDYLLSPGDDLDIAVHESRKCFKKLRGLLRLVRIEIGEEVYQRENACYRDAGRLLSDLRDSKVMIKTLDDLTEEFEEVTDGEAFDSFRQTLVIFYQATYQRLVEEEQALVNAAEMVRAARLRVDGWPVNDDEFSAVAGGLHKIYNRGQNRLKDAMEEPATEAFHEWRKRVKYLWYSARILRPIWPKPMAVLAEEIHNLSDYLGDDHDLAGLQAAVEQRPSLITDDDTRNTFNSLVNGKRTELQTLAYRQGQRVYPEPPEDFVNRMEAYWEASHI